MKILVRAPNWIGDQILAYPFFHFLRQAFPRARITSVCVPWVDSIQFRNLVDDVFVLPQASPKISGEEAGWIDKWKVLEAAAGRLRKEGPWDLAISLPNSLSAAWLLFRSGARVRRGYLTDGRSFLLNDGVHSDPAAERHRSQSYVDLLPLKARPSGGIRAREFWGVPPENELDPGKLGELVAPDLERVWPGFERLAPPVEPYWVLAPGAVATSRRWPDSSFATFARRMIHETGWPGVIVGGPKEAPLAQRLTEDRTLKLKDWTARCPIPGLTKVFAHAKITITNDSGLAHVASFCGSPVQVVWGAGDPARTEPIGPGKVRTMVNPVDCWPCERNECDQPVDRYLQCLKGIQPEGLWEEVQRGIRTPARS